MNLTVALTGALPAVVIASAVMMALVSVFLLWLYRRAVVHAMSAQAGIAVAPPKTGPTATTVRRGTSPVLTIVDSTYQPESASSVGAAYRQAIQSLNQAAIVYALGGLAYALVQTSAWMITAKGGFILTRFLWLLSCYCWPIVLAASLINPAIKKRAAISYCAIVLLIGGIGLVRSPDPTVCQLLFFWLFANGPGTVLLLAFLNRRARAVGPLVLAFMVAAVTGAVIIVNVVGSSEGLMRGVVNVGSGMGMGATTIFVLLHGIGFGLFGLLGWPLLRRLGRGYQEKRMSDQSITLDALWLLFGVVQSFTLVIEGWAWIFTGLVAFASYDLTVRLGFTLLARRGKDIVEGRTLLLLRVFSLG